MKKVLFALAVTVGIALGGVVLTTSNALACGGKDKGTTSEQPATGSGDSTQS